MTQAVLLPLRWPPKDPDEVLDYRLDWIGTRYANGPLYGASDRIVNSLWIVPAGISKESDLHDDGATTIWLSGGADGDELTLLNRITTAEGRVFDQSVILPIRQK
jgi:hypothetical protein